MAVTVPPEVDWLLELLAGQSWPQGDEDALRRAAQSWMDAMLKTAQLAGNTDLSSLRVHANADAASADDFGSFWDSYVKTHPDLQGNGNLPDLFRQYEAQAKLLVGQANEVEYTKLIIVCTLILTAIQIAWAVAMAFLTDGASLVEVPPLMAAGRLAVLRMAGRFVQMVLMMVVPDLIAQGVILAQGRGWDWGKTGTAFENGLAGGAFAMTLGGLAEKLLPWMRAGAATTLDARFLNLATHYVEGGLVNDATAITVAKLNGAPAPGWDQLGAQFLQGGTLATAFHLPGLLNADGVKITFTGSDGNTYLPLLSGHRRREFSADHWTASGRALHPGVQRQRLAGRERDLRRLGGQPPRAADQPGRLHLVLRPSATPVRVPAPAC